LVGGDPVVFVDLGLVEFQERGQGRDGLEVSELLRVDLLWVWLSFRDVPDQAVRS
jgi:hypothetical protein